MSLSQYAFRFYNDDGGEATSTPYAAENTNITWPLDTNIRLRIGITHDGSAAPSTSKYMLFAARQGTGQWFEVASGGSGRIRLSKSAGSPNNIADGGQNTSNRLSKPGVSPTPTFVAGRIWDDESGSDDVAIASGQFTELEFCLAANSALVSNGQIFDFKVMRFVAAVGSAEATALISHMGSVGSTPDATRQNVIATLINALVASGVWAKMDRLYVFAAHEAIAARINWKSPGTDTLSVTGSPTFTIDRGYKGDNTAALLNSATNMDALSLLQQNDAHLAIWVRTGDTADFKSDVAAGATVSARIASNSSNNHAYSLNGTSVQSVANGAVTTGLLMADRSVSTTVALYRNGVAFDSKADTSTPPSNTPITFLGVSGGFSDAELLAGCFGASLSGGTLAADLYNALNAYKTSVGA